VAGLAARDRITSKSYDGEKIDVTRDCTGYFKLEIRYIHCNENFITYVIHMHLT
jgi:hypothetical protein